MKKRVFCILLAVLIMTSSIVTETASAAPKEITLSEVKAKMDNYMKVITDYAAANGAENVYWNAGISNEKTLKSMADKGDYTSCLTFTKCKVSGKGHKGSGCSSNQFSYCCQCVGFAKYFCYVLYGTSPDTSSTKTKTTNWTRFNKNTSSYPGLQPGDYIWYSSGPHAAVVYSVEGGKITVIDCNQSKKPCVIAKHKSWLPPNDTSNESAFETLYKNGEAFICRYNGITAESEKSPEECLEIITNGPPAKIDRVPIADMTVTSVNTKGYAPAHTGPAGKDSVTTKFKLGDTFPVYDMTVNSSKNLWYQLENGDWIYSNYVTEKKASQPVQPKTKACSHSYDSVGKCTKCGEQFKLSITTIDKTMKVTSVNSSGTAPSHSTPYGDASIGKRYNKGDTVKVKGQATNAAGNLWYQLSDGSWLVSTYLTEVKEACSHTYDSVGKCTKCGEQFKLNITAIDKTMKVTSVNSSGTAPSHSTPYGDASIGKRYNKGDTVKVKGQAKNAAGNLWYQLSDGSWLVSTYLTEVKETTVNTKKGTVHVPSGSNGLAINDKPAASPKYSNELGVIPPGGRVTVYPDKTSGKWYWVEYNGVQGYAHSNYITLD